MRLPKYALALAAGLGAMTTDAVARVPEQPIVVVDCRLGESGDDALCRAMMDAIAALAAPTAVLRHADAPGPLRDADLGVTFVLDHRDDMGLAGHLEWQVGSDGTRHSGPVVRLDVMDTTVSPSLYPGFARSLLQVDPGLSATLQTSF